jgi:acyl-CoA synthetase (AMP-forming)/AMP-acid ligase II/tetratricopeptide (TPR) repeat protein/acyl carrier protein
MKQRRSKGSVALAEGEPFRFQMPSSLHAALTAAVAAHPEGAFIFTRHAREPDSLSYTACRTAALRVLFGLQRHGLEAGDLLILDAGDPATFIPALWAALLGGLIAIPLTYSEWNVRGQGEFRDRLDRVRRQLNDPMVVSDHEDRFGGGKRHCISFRSLAEAAREGVAVASDPSAPAVLISTSGTTGRPQLVTLSGRALMHRWWPQGPSAPNRVVFLNWMPLDHVMGLGFAGPNSMQKIHLPAASFVRDPFAWLDLVGRYGVTHAGMSNFGMKLIVDHAWDDPCDLTSLQRVGVGTEMISPATGQRFLAKLIRHGASPDAVILGYGLSECGPVAGGTRSFQPDDSNTSIVPPMIDGPTQGHAIRITGQHGELLTEGEVGAIEVRGPTLCSGYFGDPQVNAQLFTADGWFRTGDSGYLQDGCLCVTGREKETIAINARKFSCAEIDAVLQGIEGITSAHVFACFDRREQTERAAVVYTLADPAAVRADFEAQMRRICSEHFGFGLTYCVETSERMLPRTRSGKLQRNRLAELFQPEERRTGRPEVMASRDLADRIARLMARFLPGGIPGLADDFFELGGDSLGAMLFTVALEKELQLTLPPALFTRHPSVEGVLAARGDRAQTSQGLTLVPVQSGSSGVSLFLTPGVQGNNAYAEQLAKEMGAEYSVWTFHLTDPRAPELRIQSVSELARQCCELMRGVQVCGPYHLAGYSFGGWLAYEMARQLTAAGEVVGTVAIIDATAKLEQRDFAVDPSGNDDRLNAHLRLLSKRYWPDVLDGRIMYFRAKDSAYLTCSDRTAGWSYLARGGVCLYEIPGDHHSIVRGEPRRLIARHLAAGIGGARGVLCPHLPISDVARSVIAAARAAAFEGKRGLEIQLLLRALASEPDLPYWVPVWLAQALFEAGEEKLARRAVLAALQRDPWPLTTYFRLRWVLHARKSSAIAQQALQLAVTTSVDSPATARVKGILCALLGDEESSETSYRDGLRLVPESAELRLHLIELLVGQSRFPEAEEQFQMTLAVPIENPIVYQRLGQEALRLKRIDLAERCLRQSLMIDPDAPVAQALLASITDAGDEVSCLE